jgi:hypothetical protein
VAKDVSVGLTEALRELRRELTAAMAAGAGEALRFELGPVEIEFAVTVCRDAGATAGVNFAVVSADVKGDASAERVHRLKLTLVPKDSATGRAPEVMGLIDHIPAG